MNQLVKENFKINKNSLIKSIEKSGILEVHQEENGLFTVYNLMGSRPSVSFNGNLEQLWNYHHQYDDYYVENGNKYKLIY